LSVVPASLFGIPVGLLGLAGAWHVGARIWKLPSILGDIISVAGGIVWLILVAMYAHKWYRHRPAAKREARDPVQSSFVSLGLISTMLVSISVLQLSRDVAVALFAVSLAGQLALGAWLVGRAWQGGQGDFVTPALYLPAVGQNFVAASGAMALGWPEIAAWLFGCGALSWFATESIVLGRAATREPLPAALRAALGVQLAPPVVGGAAYLSLTTGSPDLVAQMLFGYGLYQTMLLLRLWRWVRLPNFSAGYWSVSFGATALPTMAMRMVERGDSGPIASVAPVLFVGANLVIAYLTLSSLRLVVRRRPVPLPSV
jgi:tellurite resistance protein